MSHGRTTTRIVSYLDDEVYKWVDEKAAKNGETVGGMVRKLMERMKKDEWENPPDYNKGIHKTGDRVRMWDRYHKTSQIVIVPELDTDGNEIKEWD